MYRTVRKGSSLQHGDHQGTRSNRAPFDTSFLCSFSLNFLNSQFYTLVCVKPAFCLNLTKPVFIEYIYKLHLFLTIFLIKLRVKQNFLFLRKWYLSIIDTSFLCSFSLDFLNSLFYKLACVPNQPFV